MESACKTIVFRVDASLEIGTGHVMRCLSLADGLKREGADIVFICREHEEHLSAVIEDRGYVVRGLPAPVRGWKPSHDEPRHASWLGADWQTDSDQTMAALSGVRPNWLVVDHYALDARWEDRLRRASDRILVIDDLADRPHKCDAIVDQSLMPNAGERYSELVPENAVGMFGPDYALLRSEYKELHEKIEPRSGPVARVLVSFGGVDRQGLTRAAVEALLSIGSHHFEADIVLPAVSPDYFRLKREIAGHENLHLHDRVPSLAKMMASADLMIGGCGTTSWERLCVGLPAIVITLADNQRAIAKELDRRGLVRWIGDAEAQTGNTLSDTLTDIFDGGLNENWSRRCLEVVDGKGTDRVCAVLAANPGMSMEIREALPRDEALLLQWANDPDTRRNAFSSKQITPEEHHRWFHRRINRPSDCILCIAQTESGVPVGQVRFERHDNSWEISFALAPVFRGAGLGRPMLTRAIGYLRRQKSCCTLFSQVKSQNMASRKIFETLGFIGRAKPDRYIYERNLRE